MVSSKCRLSVNPARHSEYATQAIKVHKRQKKKKKLKIPNQRATRAMEQMFHELMQRLLLANHYEKKFNQYKNQTSANVSFSHFIAQG